MKSTQTKWRAEHRSGSPFSFLLFASIQSVRCYASIRNANIHTIHRNSFANRNHQIAAAIDNLRPDSKYVLWIHTDIHLRRLYLKLPAVDEVLRVKEFFPFKILLALASQRVHCQMHSSVYLQPSVAFLG